MSQVTIHPASSGSAPAPYIGATYLGFEQHVAPPAARGKLRADSIEILSKCTLNAERVQANTGLVVGQIQSGKTMSYEALICLARDNGFALVIVISGISTILLDQGQGRLGDDLSTAAPGAWHFLVNPTQEDGSSRRILESVQSDWGDEDVPPARRRTAVISVLKHHRHLTNLSSLLESLNWVGTKVLIVDDEADQASLNTNKRSPTGSTTYRTLIGLRRVFPHFSYIQYTATPQAPLLISIADALSPKFVHVLDPGLGYTGGERFFGDDTGLVRAVPPTDIVQSSGSSLDVPKSLVDATRVFYLGLAVALRDNDFQDCRSMLVHPSQGTTLHELYVQWCEGLRRHWHQVVDARHTNPEDFQDLLHQFEGARQDLMGTVGDIPTLTELTPFLKLALGKTNVMEMNTRINQGTPRVPWKDFNGFVLVGGQALDRGFTIRGLTVTYMPRGLGVGNADTVQQRARFFGYKEAYLGYCRVYLESGLGRAFKDYVDHEKDIRGRLKRVQTDGTPLSEWRRAFILDPGMRPTRQAVLRSGFVADKISDRWFFDRRPAHDSLSLMQTSDAVDKFKSGLRFEEVKIPGGNQRHQLARKVSLRSAIELLAQIPCVDESISMTVTGLLIQLEQALEEQGEEDCDVYLIRPGIRTVRSLYADGLTIKALFQGRNSNNNGFRYEGDAAYRAEDRVSIQIHSVDLELSGSLAAERVPILAVWVPARVAQGWYVQR
jgi:hypothetical protein